MPDLSFRISGVEPAARGLAPLLQFRLQVTRGTAGGVAAATAAKSGGAIQGVLLNAQIQFAPAQRTYTAREQANLVELFGLPDDWGNTLRNRLWAHATAMIGPFQDAVEAVLSVPCTYDLNIAVTKYTAGLEGGDIPLLFLFSGSLFYATAEGRLQIAPIPWDKECRYEMPLGTWREMMDRHYPNSAWLTVRCETFARLAAFKRRHVLTTWDEVVARLLPTEPAGAAAAPEEVVA